MDAPFANLGVVGWFPRVAGQFEDAVRNHHEEGRASLRIPATNALSSDIPWRIKDVDDHLQTALIGATIDFIAVVAPHQTKLQYRSRPTR